MAEKRTLFAIAAQWNFPRLEYAQELQLSLVGHLGYFKSKFSR